MHKQQKWLLISYFLNLEGMAASIHCDDRLQPLADRNINLILLSSFAGKHYATFKHHRIFSITPSGFRYELRHTLKKRIHNKFLYQWAVLACFFWLWPAYILECLLLKNKRLRLDLSWSWGISGGLKAAWLAWINDIDIIYSSGGSVSTQSAAWLASKLTGKPWMAEMQDPLTHQYNKKYPSELRFNLWIEKKIAAQASAMIFLTQGAIEAASRRLPHSKHKFKQLRPGLKPLEMNHTSPNYLPPPHSTLLFRHLGTLDGTRNLQGFLEGITHALALSPFSWQLDLYGHIGKIVHHQIASSAHKNTIHFHGKLSRNASIQLMLQPGVLLLIQNVSEESPETIPSKVYEYLQTQRPILGLVYRNPELTELLRSQGHFVAEADHPQEIATAINAIHEAFQKGSLEHSVKPYTYGLDQSIDQLITIAETIKRD
jgi:hypothetical protein